jgi:hypothetical protein
MRSSPLPIFLLCVASACGPNLALPPAPLVPVSGGASFAEGCNGPVQPGVRSPGAAVEPFVVVDPNNPRHLIGAWQQDRWAFGGGADGLRSAVSWDGGKTWTLSTAPLSRCAGGTSANGGEYDRSSDPWLAFAPDGTAFESSISYDLVDPAQATAVLVSRSTNGGASWEDPVTLIRDLQGGDVLNDKESITADPFDPQRAYAIWDRVSGLLNPDPTRIRGPTWFARRVGGVWEGAHSIFDPGLNQQTIGNQIGVLPDGTLLDVMVWLTNASSAALVGNVAVLRSGDHGATWSAPIVISSLQTVGVLNYKNGFNIRVGDAVPNIAIDPVSGQAYVIWQDARFSQGAHNGIVLSTSVDRGENWSTPVQVNQAPAAPAFVPAIAVGRGVVAVSYYDLRNDSPGDPRHLVATGWLAQSADHGQTWSEAALTQAFDLSASRVGDDYLFLGDYQGLAATPDGFLSFLALANALPTSNPTEVEAEPFIP